MKNLLSAQRSSAPTVGRRFRMHAGVLAVVLAAGCAVPAASADVITDWNQQLLDSIRASNVAPPAASRMMAMMHTAQHDAVNAVSNRYATYQQGFSAPSNTSKEAAAAKAARDVLATFFPSRVSQFDSQLNTHLSTLAPGASRDQGVALGSAVASGIFNTRSTDGSANALPPETGGNIPGQWAASRPLLSTHRSSSCQAHHRLSTVLSMPRRIAKSAIWVALPARSARSIRPIPRSCGVLALTQSRPLASGTKSLSRL
jgi:hypothetical protein